ncbi:Mitochondrial import inner membrane translocase subunit Tim21 [Amphibalanus amphitrite]|uniref:Mitochondrial import inner membrane translocase subunit Tim21 n=2 Tax=Amphibalanus amphitrite TaxID=1232801 RepID=A0A6A4WHU4_AMPAM|nr:mitochondrial import inner membrane translocase subunit Tim21-like isoform X2 [Amphibalanus amphitrite]XP_043237981.1 mitochondrial import inner membrane translocase subunit Tim21-like isoform X2 [Amphibalanus amphitrite]KAF0304819.1 Mitochondrial import inner membrane translocase subunit Tim21 [Amphibalanus amphitrite]KAF0308984.1 Mitochondrial import inner membrane translocase subunit Tim21 [Amphibalanus amphitrite]
MSFLSTHKIMMVARTLSYCKHLRQVKTGLSECPSIVYVAFSNCQRRLYAEDSSNKGAVSKASSSDVGDAKPITFKEKVKENTKTTGYGLIMLGGIGVTAVMFYAIFRELFSSKSPNSVYSAALQRCAEEPRVVDTLGAPVKGHGEETRRGRRRHVSHLNYQQDGVNHMRMKFYIDGSRQSGTVYLDVRESPETGRYEYRYLFVEVDGSRRVIVLEDNRASEPRSLPALPPLKDYSQPRSEM